MKPSHGCQTGIFQDRVTRWLIACFGEKVAYDKMERNHRFLEEAMELVQAFGCTASEAHQLVDYVFGRPAGECGQELGGVMVTLAALCAAHELDMGDCGEIELDRVWAKIEQIRAKQARKPKHSPLPGGSVPEPQAPATDDRDLLASAMQEDEELRAGRHSRSNIERRRWDMELEPSDELPGRKAP